MSDRTLLGPADVSDAELTRMVAALLDHDPTSVTLDDVAVEQVDYAVPSITTAGRYWVSGTASTPAGHKAYRLFVKHVQAWVRSPFFAEVPSEFAELAAAGVPWRTEPLAYRSDLGDRLPDGLTMPRALGVFDLDELSAAVWLEEVSHPPRPWDRPRFERAAHLLGRLAASRRVAPLRHVGEFDWSVHAYVHGRIHAQVMPILASDIWDHPLVAGAFDADLRDRIRAAAERAPAYADELATFPALNGHGDASPNNLLPGATADSFVLIDYGFWQELPLGYDVSQLVVGQVQIGERGCDDLAELDAACVSAYTAGLAAESLVVDESAVRRAHALQLLLFSGVSSVPFELLGAPITPELERVAAARAAIARHSLDLVASTGD
jgi:hypothetical protein